MVEQVEETIRQKLTQVPLTDRDRKFLRGLLLLVEAHLDSNQQSGWQFQAKVEQVLEGLMLPETFGQRVAYYRDRAGMLQRDLAARIGMQAASLSRIENGKINPPKIARVLAMCRALNLLPAHTLGLVILAGSPPESRRA